MSNSKPKDRYKARHQWYLGDAQTLIRELQEALWPLQWHVAMGGGVLNHGYSNDDLDLYILPLNKRAKSRDIADAFDGILQHTRSIDAHNPTYRDMAPAIESADVYSYQGKRVDVFVFTPQCAVCGVAERLQE